MWGAGAETAREQGTNTIRVPLSALCLRSESPIAGDTQLCPPDPRHATEFALDEGFP